MGHEVLLSFELFPLGDAAIVVQFGNTISEDIHAKVRDFTSYLDKNPFEGMIEYVPAYTTLTIYYNPWLVSEKGKSDPYQKVVNLMHRIKNQVNEQEKPISRIVEIPVCYGDEFGPDVEFVADYTNLAKEEVISIHSSGKYLVYMIGFAPGFPYLGGMHEKIAVPRRETPRPKIPAGSVGIAGKQTGVYPIETPGGWQLIGRTPLSLFQPNRQPPVLLQAGDTIHFVPISKKAYNQIKDQEDEY